MTSRLAHQHAAANLAIAGGILGMFAGATQTVIGSHIPDWTGNKASPDALGLLTVGLSLGAIAAALALRTPAVLPASRRAAAAAGLLVPGAVCFSTVGRLWYPAGLALLAAFGMTLAAGGPSEIGAVIRLNRSREFVSLLGVFEIVMAVSAGPTATLAVGITGGVLLTVGPWVARHSRRATLALVLVGSLPFAILTWWSAASPLLVLVGLTLGLTQAQRSGRAWPPTPATR